MRKGPLKEGGTEAIDSVGTLRTCLKIYFYFWFAWGQAKFNLGKDKIEEVVNAVFRCKMT